MKNFERMQQTMKYLFLAEDSTDSLEMATLLEITQVESGRIRWLGVVKTLLWTVVAIALPLLL